MPIPGLIADLIGGVRESRSNQRGTSATEQLMDQLKARYNDPGTGARPADPTDLFNRTEAVAQAEGGNAAYKFLLGETDPARLAEMQALEQKNRQGAQDAQNTRNQYQRHMQFVQGPQAGDLGPLMAMMDPGKAGAAGVADIRQDKQITADQALMDSRTQSGLAKPMTQKEYEFYKSLPSDEDRKTYMRIKRGDKYVQTGGGGVDIVDQVGGGRTNVVDAAEFGANLGVSNIETEELKRQYGETVALPQLRAQSGETIRQANAALNHPGFDAYYGVTSMLPTVPGSDAANFGTFVAQGQGKVFLNVYESLKGAGQITEIETEKGEKALSTIADEKQSPETARAAWQQLIDITKSGLARKEAAAITDYGVGRKSPKTSGTGASRAKTYVPGKGFQ